MQSREPGGGIPCEGGPGCVWVPVLGGLAGGWGRAQGSWEWVGAGPGAWGELLGAGPRKWGVRKWEGGVLGGMEAEWLFQALEGRIVVTQAGGA